jgi:hypothetical protein
LRAIGTGASIAVVVESWLNVNVVEGAVLAPKPVAGFSVSALDFSVVPNNGVAGFEVSAAAGPPNNEPPVEGAKPVVLGVVVVALG